MRELAEILEGWLGGVSGREQRRRAAWLFGWLTLATDLTAIAAGLGLATIIREWVSARGLARAPDIGFVYTFFPQVLAYYWASLWVAFSFVDVYRDRRFLTGNREAGRIVKAVVAFTLVNAVLAYVFPTRLLFSRLTLLLACLFICVLATLGRHAVGELRAALRRRGRDLSVALIVGTDPAAERLVEELRDAEHHGYRLAGLLARSGDAKGRLGGARILGGLERLERVLHRLRVDEVFICAPTGDAHEVMPLFARLRPTGVQIRLVSRLFDVVIERVGVPVDFLGDEPILDFAHGEPGRSYAAGKRLLDAAVAGAGLLALSPLWALIAAAIYVESGRPIFFRQIRVGRDGRQFACYKFRTMIPDAEKRLAELAARNEVAGPMFKMRADPRVTRVGRLLRRYSLDEFPQLLNVLRGDMSLVGPRPPVPREVAEYEKWHLQRLDGPMGLSGLWQVSGRNELDFEEMALLDIYYLRNRNLFLDLRILLRTAFTVCLGQGR